MKLTYENAEILIYLTWHNSDCLKNSIKKVQEMYVNN
jgi:hypothetical protein